MVRIKDFSSKRKKRDIGMKAKKISKKKNLVIPFELESYELKETQNYHLIS